jgi:hypothetical protein
MNCKLWDRDKIYYKNTFNTLMLLLVFVSCSPDIDRDVTASLRLEVLFFCHQEFRELRNYSFYLVTLLNTQFD